MTSSVWQYFFGKKILGVSSKALARGLILRVLLGCQYCLWNGSGLLGLFQISYALFSLIVLNYKYEDLWLLSAYEAIECAPMTKEYFLLFLLKTPDTTGRITDQQRHQASENSTFYMKNYLLDVFDSSSVFFFSDKRRSYFVRLSFPFIYPSIHLPSSTFGSYHFKSHMIIKPAQSFPFSLIYLPLSHPLEGMDPSCSPIVFA